jgi:hypothetical protein
VDNALFSLLFFFFVQISAGVAPMRWPQCKWLAGVIFWISSAGAAACLIWYGYSQGWFSMAITMAGRQTFGILVLICGAGLGVLGLSIIAAGETTKTASIILQSDTYRFGETIYIESRSVLAPDGRDTKLYETNFFIVVSNALEDGRTLRSLQVEIRGYETPVIAPIRGNQPEKIDLKHGQAAFFQVGRIVRSHFFGNFVGTVGRPPFGGPG